MSLSAIAIILGLLAVIGSFMALFKPEAVKKGIELFPRSVVPAWILTGLCCWLGAREAMEMNMGFLDEYKKYIYFIAPAVFAASVIYMKELLAARSLGGFLCLIAVPILQIARWHESPWRLVIVTIVYIWIVFGIFLIMSPWYYRKITALVVKNDKFLKIGSAVKLALGIGIILLGIFVF
ncbi:MAG: hypothetical protein K9M45_06120 [Kiritimatiellales bacterium]|nr:hypothetical protein [Kiritimatiellales bacterium]